MEFLCFFKRLPRFFGGLNPDGCGVVIFRYGGTAHQVLVYRRIVCMGWSLFVRTAKLRSGCKLLMCHSYGREISVLRFKRGVGRNAVWEFNVQAQVLTRLIEPIALPPDADSEVRHTAIFPRYMSALLSTPSGTRIFKMYDYFCMVLTSISSSILYLCIVYMKNYLTLYNSLQI